MQFAAIRRPDHQYARTRSRTVYPFQHSDKVSAILFSGPPWAVRLIGPISENHQRGISGPYFGCPDGLAPAKHDVRLRAIDPQRFKSEPAPVLDSPAEQAHGRSFQGAQREFMSPRQQPVRYRPWPRF